MSEASDIEKVLRKAERQGIRVVRDGNKVWVYSPDGRDKHLFHKAHTGAGNVRQVVRVLRRFGYRP